MTRRERLERKLEKREEWAEKADARGDERFQRGHDLVKDIPLGQPILVGHHSEKAHRRTLERSHNHMFKGCEEKALASHHRSKADGLDRILKTNIFSDDEDAIERLQEKITELETARERMKAINKVYKKTDGADWFERIDNMKLSPPLTERERAGIVSNLRFSPGGPTKPYPAYVTTNIGGRIRQAKKRIEAIQGRQQRAEQAEAAGGVSIQRHEEHNWCVVTFAEKPEREILQALKAAGYRWGSGSWRGYLDRLPEGIA